MKLMLSPSPFREVIKKKFFNLKPALWTVHDSLIVKKLIFSLKEKTKQKTNKSIWRKLNLTWFDFYDKEIEEWI